MRLRICLALVCFIGLAASAADAAQAPAPVGGPPTNGDGRCSHDQLPCGDPIVVGSSDETPLPVELVGYTSRAGLCVGLDVQAHQLGAICGVQPAEQNAIQYVGESSSIRTAGQKFSYVYGALRDDVTSVDVTYRQHGVTRAATPVIAFIRGRLQERLGQSKPITDFVAMARGCVGHGHFKITAYDANGNVLGQSDGAPVAEKANSCARPSAPPSTAPAPVGGPPTQDFPRCDRELKPCGDPIVVGSGRTALGPVEVIAFTSGLGLCKEVDLLEGSSATTCTPKEPGTTIRVDLTGSGLASHHRPYTLVLGSFRNSVDHVSASVGDPAPAIAPVVGRIEGDLQERLDQRRPLGLFVVAVRGCVKPSLIHVYAYDADGAVIGRTRGLEHVSACTPPGALRTAM